MYLHQRFKIFTFIHHIASSVGVSHLRMLGKSFPQSHLTIIIIRECPQNNSTHILRYFNNFSMIPFIQTPFTPLPTHLFTNTSIMKDKKVLSFSLLMLDKFLSTFSIGISVFFSNAINCILLNILTFLKGKFVQ